MCASDAVSGTWTPRPDSDQIKELAEEQGSCVGRADVSGFAAAVPFRLCWRYWGRPAETARNDAGDLHRYGHWKIGGLAALSSFDSDGGMRLAGKKREPRLVAGDHVLGYALQADDRIRDKGQTPELVVVFAQIVGGKYGGSTLGGGDSISASHCRVSAIKVRGLNLHVADTFLASKPVFRGK